MTYVASFDQIANAMIRKDRDYFFENKLAIKAIYLAISIWKEKYPDDFPSMTQTIADYPLEYWVKPLPEQEGFDTL